MPHRPAFRLRKSKAARDKLAAAFLLGVGLFTPPLLATIIEKGWVNITDRPGIGVEMNDAAARKLVLRGTKWFDEA